MSSINNRMLKIKNEEINYCLDSMSTSDLEHSFPGTFYCHNQGGPNQMFVYSKQQTISNGELCLDLNKESLPITLKFSKCQVGLLSQKWLYSSKVREFKNIFF